MRYEFITLRCGRGDCGLRVLVGALCAAFISSGPRPHGTGEWRKQQVNALQVDGPVAVVRNAGPLAATPVGLLEIKWMGL